MSTLHTSAAERASSQCVNLIRGVSLRSPAASAAHLAASPDLYDLAAVLQDRLAQPPAPPSDPYDMEAVAALLDMGSDSEAENSPPSATVTVTHTALLELFCWWCSVGGALLTVLLVALCCCSAYCCCCERCDRGVAAAVLSDHRRDWCCAACCCSDAYCTIRDLKMSQLLLLLCLMLQWRMLLKRCLGCRRCCAEHTSSKVPVTTTQAAVRSSDTFSRAQDVRGEPVLNYRANTQEQQVDSLLT